MEILTDGYPFFQKWSYKHALFYFPLCGDFFLLNSSYFKQKNIIQYLANSDFILVKLVKINLKKKSFPSTFWKLLPDNQNYIIHHPMFFISQLMKCFEPFHYQTCYNFASDDHSTINFDQSRSITDHRAQ